MVTRAGGATIPSTGAAPFVGRSRERALLADELRLGTRLLTLTGPSGIGKTRLALQASKEAAPSFDGGVGVCELASCVTSEELEAEVARKIRAANARGPALAEAIASRGPMLLVLDDADDLTPVARERIAGWLDRCVELQILATSIVPLVLEEEHRFELGPMEAEDAISLYLERARRAWVNRPVPEGEERAVGELVRQLDGIPLAIELAAARVRVLPPAALLSRMDERLELLRDDGAGQRSLLRALSLTWDFLDPGERTSLATLSVFEGGFTLEAAAAVLGDADVGTIDSLRGKALVRLDPSTPARFSLLESVRAFGRRELARLDPAGRAARTHAAFFAREGELHASRVDGGGAPAAIAWLAAERPNLVAARDRSRSFAPAIAARLGLVLLSLRGEMGTPVLDGGQADDALRDARVSADPELICRALRSRAEAWRRQSRLDEALAALDEAVALASAGGKSQETLASTGALAAGPGGNSQEMLARIGALTASSGLATEEALARIDRATVRIRQGALDDARAEVDRAMDLSGGEGRIEGLASLAAGAEAMARGEAIEAEERYRRARSRMAACGDLRREAEALLWLSSAWIETGRFEEAIRAVREAGDAFRRIGSGSAEAAIALNLGGAHLAAGNLDEAEEASATALDLNRRNGHRRNEAIALSNLGLVAVERSRFARASQLLREACGILEVGGERRYHVPILPFLAFVAAVDGRRGESERLLAEARSFFTGIGDGGNLRVVEVLECAVAIQRGSEPPGPSSPRASATSDGDDPSSGESARVRARELLATAGTSPSSESLFPALRLLERTLAAPQREADPAATTGLAVAADGSWFDTGSGRISLRRRNTLRRLLFALVEARRDSPGAGIGQPELFRRVWDGEAAQPEAAARRVYFAVWTLRSLGLSGTLLSRADGYLLDPAISLMVEPRPGGTSKIA